MTILSKLKIDEKDIVVRLPYRAGLWISQSDETGGTAADDAEMTALNNIMEGFTSEIFGSEDVQHIMAETMKERQRWPEWGADLQDVPDEAMQAVDILALHCDPKELSAFKHRLYEIGEAVAMAFCEVDEAPKEPGFFAKLLGLGRGANGGAASISDKERKALNMLAAALNIETT